ncbi:MAG TPA: DUF58 domain-containing protein [Egibacteraceae bacterium]|nr:DUF58 domain-containing protein [Egibacteraceae bacterium]
MGQRQPGAATGTAAAVPPPPAGGLLAPDLVGRLRRLRLGSRSRVEGRFAGAHASRRYGSSLDFADYREYVEGDDLRWVDPHAHARLGRLLVKLFEAEDESALRVVLDLSGSMGFGRKAEAAAKTAAALTVVACGGGDRARLILAGERIDAGPWLRGPAALRQAEVRLRSAVTAGLSDLPAALRRARGEGPRGPVVLISDLLFDGWPDALRALATGPGDAAVIHVLGADDLEPRLRGDLRLADVETDVEVEVGIAEKALRAYAEARDAWLSEVEQACAGRGIAYARLIDHESIDRLFSVTLTQLGVVG